MTHARGVARWLLPRATVAALAAACAVVVAGCDPRVSACLGNGPEHVTVLAFTSKSDLRLSRELAPRVAARAGRRAARSCGEIAAGIVRPRPESTLEIHTRPLPAKHDRVASAKPEVERRNELAQSLLRRRLLEPLTATRPSSGSPFLSALSKLAHETRALRRPPGTIVLIGDSIARERSPSGALVDFRRPVPAEVLAEFVPRLRSLRGSCVMILGQGGGGLERARRIRAARRMLRETLAKADVGFLATRSSVLPQGCPRATA